MLFLRFIVFTETLESFLLFYFLTFSKRFLFSLFLHFEFLKKYFIILFTLIFSFFSFFLIFLSSSPPSFLWFCFFSPSVSCFGFVFFSPSVFGRTLKFLLVMRLQFLIPGKWGPSIQCHYFQVNSDLMVVPVTIYLCAKYCIRLQYLKLFNSVQKIINIE